MGGRRFEGIDSSLLLFGAKFDARHGHSQGRLVSELRSDSQTPTPVTLSVPKMINQSRWRESKVSIGSDQETLSNQPPLPPRRTRTKKIKVVSSKVESTTIQKPKIPPRPSIIVEDVSIKKPEAPIVQKADEREERPKEIPLIPPSPDNSPILVSIPLNELAPKPSLKMTINTKDIQTREEVIAKLESNDTDSSVVKERRLITTPGGLDRKNTYTMEVSYLLLFYWFLQLFLVYFVLFGYQKFLSLFI